MLSTLTVDRLLHVPESRFGVWFLGTDIWETYVLEFAINDLKNLIGNRKASYPVIVDLGCGSGRSFKLLNKHFAPELIIGADIDTDMLRLSKQEAKRQGLEVRLIQGTSASLALADQSVDLLLCHQTFHHLVDQQSAIHEFHRVLKPGGLLLFAESTRAFIHSWIIRLLFRHPMDVQKSASEYLSVIENAGFKIAPDAVSYPYLWWSRTDLGIRERVFGRPPAPSHEETLLNVVAVRN
ncbi:MAG: methyltransferase domain-containing protein [Alphaproteobacteria bacterium]|nr:methyltransferase domain-containing protein [Alphaproteobacteria bacterium]